MKYVWALLGLAVCAPASGAPLPLYDSSRDPLGIAPLAPAPSCGGFAVACSDAPSPPKTVLPFEFGGTVSGVVGGISHVGAVSGEAASVWVKAKDVPLTLYFSYARIQPLGK